MEHLEHGPSDNFQARIANSPKAKIGKEVSRIHTASLQASPSVGHRSPKGCNPGDRTTKDQRMDIASAEEGVWGCTFVGYCSEVCPKQVDPAAAIQQNKIVSTTDYMLSFVKPRGGGQ